MSIANLTRIDPKTWDKNRVQWLWEHVQTQDYFWDDNTVGNPNYFIAMLFTPGTEHYEYGDDGYIVVNSIRPNCDACFHHAVWGDKVSLRKSLETSRALFRDLFDRYKLNRLTSMVPSFNKAAVKLAVISGFKYEGALRKAHLYKGEYYDILLYGLLKSEFDKLEGSCRLPLSQLQ